MNGCIENPTPYHSYANPIYGSMEDPQERRKCVKRKEEEVNLVFGDGVKLNEITHMESKSLVGNFSIRKMTRDMMKICTSTHFLPILGYEPKFLTLAKGRLAWIMHATINANKLLFSRWRWSSKALFLKKWFVEFYASTKRMAITLVWVLLPGLPLILWLEEVFKYIGNSPGFFYEANISYKYFGYMGMDRILVGLKLFGGIFDSISIQFVKNTYHQILDY
jgi:hypothetical protein